MAEASADPGIPLPSQIPSASSTPKPITKPTSIKSALASLPSNTDAFLGRLQKALSTPAGTDTILLFLCYGSKLISELLAGAGITTLKHKARQLVALALSFPAAGGTGGTIAAAEVLVAPASVTGLAATLIGLSDRLKALSGMLSDVRAFSRLWGLLGMYFWAKRLIKQEGAPKSFDSVMNYASLGTCITFQAMENVAYLGSKKVLAVSPQRQGQLWRWSSKFWAAYVALDLGRMLKELVKRRNTRQQRRVQRLKAARENMDPSAAAEAGKSLEEEEKQWLVNWRRGFARQAAWAPLTLHYSSEKGLLSEGMIGLLGIVPGIIQIGDLWREAGKP